MKLLPLLILITSVANAAEPGFESLFDGKTLDGWTHKGNWEVVNGEMTRVKKGGPLTYAKAKVPDDFELRFDWKVAKGCNSGVYYRPGQYEYQLLDNANSTYGENPRSCAGALYFCMGPTKDVVRPFNEWNEGRIICKGTVIQHWLNGEKVVDFDYTDPRWAAEVKLVGYRGTDLSRRGGDLWLQDHGENVSFRNLRWRKIPADEKLVTENLTPLPLSEAALKKEQARIQELIHAKEKKPKAEASKEPGKKTPSKPAGTWRHEELKRFTADEARQGVAVDAAFFYAITNEAIGKYHKTTGEKVSGWKDAKDGRIKHLNAGVVLDGKLYCAHSNFPTVPMESSVEIWETQTMQHLETIDLTKIGGSLTWVDQRDGAWFACFAEYAKTGNPANTKVVQFDLKWQKMAEWKFPAEMVAEFRKNSSSGGSFGPGGHLFITGHDAQELYVLSTPKKGAELVWEAAIPISAHGQAFAWDRAEEGVLYSIERKTHEVIVSRITGK
ncbi:MAG: 3-keto-disaccharide hydrolase [Prosthecobacter sp.]